MCDSVILMSYAFRQTLFNMSKTNNTTPLLSFRCPVDLLEDIEQRMKAEKKTKTAIVVELLRSAISLPKNQSRSTPIRLEQPSSNLVTKKELDERLTKLRSAIRVDLQQQVSNSNATFDTEQINVTIAAQVTELGNKLSLQISEQLENKSSQLDLQVKDAIAESEGKLEQKLDTAIASKLLKLEAQLTNKIHAKLSKEWETIFSSAVAKTAQKTQGKSTKNIEQLEATTSAQSEPKPETEVTTNEQRSEKIEETKPQAQERKTNDIKNEQNSDKTLENKQQPEWVKKLDFDKAYSDNDIAKIIGGNQSNVYRIRTG